MLWGSVFEHQVVVHLSGLKHEGNASQGDWISFPSAPQRLKEEVVVIENR